MSGTITGSSSDILRRLKAVLPTRWFPDATPILDALLSGFAVTSATLYSMISYVRLQTRILTVTDTFIDLAASDYCGSRVFRRSGEADADLRARVLRELLRNRGTQPALIAAIEDNTGRIPAIFDPMRPANSGGYGIALGYGSAGLFGSLSMPFQCLVVAYRPFTAGASVWTGGVGPGSPAIGTILPTTSVSDSEIFAAIAQVTPVAAIAWTSLRD